MFDRLKKLFGNDAAVAPEPPPANATGAEPAATNFLCREAVFDRSNRLAGHLFRVQHASPTASSPPGLQRCFDETLLAALNGSQEAWNTSLAFLPLSSSSLFLPAIDRLKTSNLYLLVNLAADLDSDALCARMNELRNRGLSILLFRQPAHPAFAAAMACSDGGAIDLAHSEPGAVRDFSAAVRAMEKSSPLELFATGIDTLDEHHLCHQWHFAFFHGRFAETHLPTREASGGDPHKVLLLNILRLVQGEAETAEIAEAMKQDPLLAFRILRYLNSPALGLSHRIDSLAQALVILGRQRMARWLSVLLFSVREPTTTDFDSEEAETFEDGDQLRDINTPERLLMTRQIGDTVNSAMEALPEELKTAIVLREIEGLSYDEIATIMDCPIGTVRSRIFRAREAISEKLKPLLDTAPNKRW